MALSSIGAVVHNNRTDSCLAILLIGKCVSSLKESVL